MDKDENMFPGNHHKKYVEGLPSMYSGTAGIFRLTDTSVTRYVWAIDLQKILGCTSRFHEVLNKFNRPHHCLAQTKNPSLDRQNQGNTEEGNKGLGTESVPPPAVSRSQLGFIHNIG